MIKYTLLSSLRIIKVNYPEKLITTYNIILKFYLSLIWLSELVNDIPVVESTFHASSITAMYMYNHICNINGSLCVITTHLYHPIK